MFSNIIPWILANLGLALLILSTLIALTQISLQKKTVSKYEILFRWTTLLPVGLLGIYTFAMHAFLPEFSAAVIGWSNSPFQYEVAMADLGFGILAILSFKASYGFRLASVIGNTIWLWGDAIGHIYQMIEYRNFAAGNAGTWFWMDVIIPLILIICMIKLYPLRTANSG